MIEWQLSQPDPSPGLPCPATQVSCLPTCEQYGGGAKYPPVSSGDYLSAKYAATHTTYAAHNPDVDTSEAA